jgi:hypothetical protein
VRFATLPDGDCNLVDLDSSSGPIVKFKQSDSKIYAAVGTTLGATGISVTTNVWYRIDFDFNIQTAGDDFCDAQVNGVACGQATAAGLSASATHLSLGANSNVSANIFFDDVILSHTAADYPLGGGYVLSYIPNADGTHNIAGANDFERTLTGTDILNSTTDAFELVNDRPLESAAGDFINMVVPAGANDWVECAFENSAEATAPRTVELIAAIHQAGTGLGNMEIILVDNGADGTIYTATGVAGATVLSYKRAHFADPPSAATAWVLGGAINGDFNNLLVRFTSPAAVDANPDQYFDCIMIEAEYAEVVSVIYRELSISPPPYLQVTRVVAY